MQNIEENPILRNINKFKMSSEILKQPDTKYACKSKHFYPILLVYKIFQWFLHFEVLYVAATKGQT